MLSCKEITQLASEQIESDLPFMKRMQFKMHLAMCKNCRRFADQLQTTVKIVRTIKPAVPTEEEVNRQIEQILSAIPKHPTPPPRNK